MTTPQKKPYDLGNGLVCASFGTDGSWLSVGMAHPRAGLVELSGAPSFPVERDGQVDLVRAHRAHLTDPATAMLRVADARTDAVQDGEWRLHGGGWSARAQAWAEGTDATIVQRYLVTADGPAALRLEFGGRLDRPAYAEITPGGPIPPALPADRRDRRGDVAGANAGRRRGPRRPDRGDLVRAVRRGLGRHRRWVRAGGLLGGPGRSRAPARRGDDDLRRGAFPAARRPGIHGHRPGRARLVRPGRHRGGSGADTLGCTALEVAEDECCILTDHRLLPLSWTRDAYYQAALLLADADEQHGAADVVERHLMWLWRSGRDHDGVWRRSHLSTGAVKDTGYQVDQQLFPLLELVDFRRTTGGWPASDPAAWGAAGPAGVARPAPRQQRTCPRRGEPRGRPFAVPVPTVEPAAARLRRAAARRVRRRTGHGGPPAECGRGTRPRRHPCDVHLRRALRTAVGLRGRRARRSPALPRCERRAHCRRPPVGAVRRRRPAMASDDEVRLLPAQPRLRGRRTVRPRLRAHTRHLAARRCSGWAVAVVQGEWSRADAVVARLMQVVSADGMLPETYDPNSGDWLARHWFAWPGSLVGLLHATIDGRGPWVAARAPQG